MIRDEFGARHLPAPQILDKVRKFPCARIIVPLHPLDPLGIEVSGIEFTGDEISQRLDLLAASCPQVRNIRIRRISAGCVRHSEVQPAQVLEEVVVVNCAVEV